MAARQGQGGQMNVRENISIVSNLWSHVDSTTVILLDSLRSQGGLYILA